MVLKPKAYITTFLWILITVQMLAACVPQSSGKNSRRSKTDATTTTTTKPTPAAPTFPSNSELYWFTGSKITGTVTINQNMETVVYLRGAPVHNFLANDDHFSKTYCMVFGYSHSTARKQIRVRTVPITYNDFITKTTERLLRLDLPNQYDNNSTCAGTINSVSISSDIAYTPGQFCTSCFELITSTSMALYASSGGSISDSTLVAATLLNTAGLEMRIDTTSGSTSEESICTNATCINKGFDCCLNGQCVKDGFQKPNASSDPSYPQAQADIANNPLNFINWPNLYYVCSNVPRIQATPTPYPNAIATAQASFDKLVREYYCLEEGKKTTPNYANGTCSNSTTAGTKTLCNAGGGVWTYYCFENGTVTDHDTIRSSVWERCGCEADPFPTAPDEPQCPDFGLKATFDLQQKVTSVTCLIPQPVVIPTAFQKLQVSVPARTAPHRFYNSSDGLAVDDLTTLTNISPLPTSEGVEFYYLDETGKSGAENNEAFNMNAILGQLKVDLSRARPAVMITVEYDQTYIISALKGTHSPCPMCAKDSWFDAFTAFPPSTQGRGLEAIGHTTSREAYQTNITLGNYEDTIFGRACYVPPTMIPFSHMKRPGTVADQRRIRLQTQAAMFVNGYQRDWYGFNRGAVIGSFNGVSWFAIGGGRRIQAKGNKLYLAINAPFADLTQPTDVVVNIITDNGQNEAADLDYDPELTSIDANQNSGASCQKFHQCETDGDCVNQLGWEYMCINTSALKTYTPKFDLNGVEQIDEKAGGMATVLAAGVMPSTSKKRCVYRGMGAPCKVNFLADNIYTPISPSRAVGNAKIFVCAPNFFCGGLNETSIFNDQVIREPNGINNIMYGKDTDVLGRPKNYTSGGKTLPNEIKDNLKHNFALYTTTAPSDANWGLCMPGKSLAYNTWREQQGAKDNSRRTDYISQIGSCNADAVGTTRARTCPAFDMRETLTGSKANANYKNYIITDPTLLGDSSTGTPYFSVVNPNDSDFMFRKNQNMCGKEAQKSTGTNAWKDIEYVASPPSILLPGLAQNACLRRAGSLCHTDLDCSPNSLHTAQAQYLDRSYFGGGDPEQLFWKESLVCGQQEPLPYISAANFSTYSMKENRCCRKVGNDLTLFTSGTGAGSASGIPILKKLSTLFTTGSGSGFYTGKLPSEGANADGRYSRYANVPLNRVTDKGVIFQIPNINLSTAGMAKLQYQWKTINETARLTCCGGGAIRKFADGTHDWTIRDRLKIKPENFKCLNYRTELAYDEDVAQEMTHISQWQEDVTNYCIFPDAPDKPGCMQREIPGSDGGFLLSVPAAEDWTYIGSGAGALSANNIGAGVAGQIDIEVYPVSNPLGSGPGDDAQIFSNLPQRVGPQAPFIPLYSEDFSPNNPYSTYITDLKIPWYTGPDHTADVVSMKLPSYMGTYRSSSTADSVASNGLNNIEIMGITYKGPTGVRTYTKLAPNPDPNVGAGQNSQLREIQTGCTYGTASLHTALQAGDGYNQFCVFTNNGHEILSFHPVHSNVQIVGVTAPTAEFVAIAGVTIRFNRPGGPTFKKRDGNLDTRRGMVAGNSNYYLSKLGRFELLGIPQIFYEPLACNANNDKIVRDIFVDTIGESKAAFLTAGITLRNADSSAKQTVTVYQSDYAGANDTQGNGTQVVFKDKVKLPEIFSEQDFLCCKKLGEKTTDAGLCCSGYAITPTVAAGGTPLPAGTVECRLPRGTNLNVYFNRYVSTEGTGSGAPGGGLNDQDFIPETGEVAWNEDSYDKLAALGEAYCADMAIRPGGAFGNFFGEPNVLSFATNDASDTPEPLKNRVFSIVDSTKDYDVGADQIGVGYAYYSVGYRWNHHLYCSAPASP